MGGQLTTVSSIFVLHADGAQCEALVTQLNTLLTACGSGTSNQRNALTCSDDVQGTRMIVMAKQDRKTDKKVRKKLNFAMQQFAAREGLKRAVVNMASMEIGSTLSVTSDPKANKCKHVAGVLDSMLAQQYDCPAPTTTASPATMAPEPGSVQCVPHSTQSEFSKDLVFQVETALCVNKVAQVSPKILDLTFLTTSF